MRVVDLKWLSVALEDSMHNCSNIIAGLVAFCVLLSEVAKNKTSIYNVYEKPTITIVIITLCWI